MTKRTASTTLDAAGANAIARQLKRSRSAMLAALGRLVRVESPSTDKPALDHFARVLAAECRRAGAKVELSRQKKAGDHVVARFFSSARGRPILIIGHYDTVYPLGILVRMPFRVRDARAWGPGTLDMKAGIVIALSAIQALRAARIAPAAPVVCLFTSDEEIGSHSSRTLIERLARRSRAALVLEPAAGREGKLKTARKGTGEIELTVRGKSAHAGLNPQEGVNAIHEIALQIERIRGFNDPAAGATVNVGVVEGGTRSNVIPDRARALIDLRVQRAEDAAPLEARFAALNPFFSGAIIEVRGGFSRPPMERTPQVAALFAHAQRMGEMIGLPLEETGVGGGSDGNFTAALGVPTLDGLGGVGTGAHSPEEFVFADSLPERAALLALLLASIPDKLPAK